MGEEYYWVLKEALKGLQQAGIRVEYRQVSSCGGVY